MTPDISSAFNDYLDIYRDSYVTVNDIDNVFRRENSLLYTYIREYGITEIVPPYTYMKQQQTITIKGSNFINVYSLMLKMVLDISGETMYFRQDLLYIDEETLVIKMPIVESMRFVQDRRATFYVSMNGGAEWSKQTGDFIFYEEPQMTSISKTQ